MSDAGGMSLYLSGATAQASLSKDSVAVKLWDDIFLWRRSTQNRAARSPYNYILATSL
jgi:hypothetical protein